MSYSFKLQFYVHPEDRWYPNYRNPRTSTASTSTETISNDAESRLPATDAHIPSDEPTYSTDGSSSSVETSPELPDRPSTPATTEHADSRPTTPRQQLGDGFGVVPGPSRRLQRERPFSVAPDPMWNSSREIQPYERLATCVPPPPYVLPPTYAEVVPSEHIETIEEVPVEPIHVETIEIEPSTLRSPTLSVRHAAVSSTAIPRGPPAEVVVEAPPSEKARGKKRMREEDYPSDEDDEDESLGEGSSGDSGRNPSTSNCRGQPDRKRIKTDTRISTDRLEVDNEVSMVAGMGIVELPTDAEQWRQVQKLKEIEKLYRADGLLRRQG